MKERTTWWYAGPLTVVIFFIIDRLTKWYFTANSQDLYSMLNDVVRLQYHLNTDMALSLPLVPGIYYPLVGVVFCVLTYVMYKTIKRGRVWELIPILFILVGAISNLVDRILYQGVVDFINISIGNIFNLADVYIIGGVITWFLFTVHYDRKQAITKKHAE